MKQFGCINFKNMEIIEITVDLQYFVGVKNVPNTQPHSQARRKAGRAWRLLLISQHVAPLHVG